MSGKEEQLGFDQNVDYLGRAIRALVPQWVARRSITARVTTDESRYEVGDEIRITITFENRLPIPIVVETPRQRLWGWDVNGELEASDEAYYLRDQPNVFYFRAREKKRTQVRWDGRFDRRDESSRMPADPGEYTIGAYLATEERKPRDETTVVLR